MNWWDGLMHWLGIPDMLTFYAGIGCFMLLLIWQELRKIRTTYLRMMTNALYDINYKQTPGFHDHR